MLILQLLSLKRRNKRRKKRRKKRRRKRKRKRRKKRRKRGGGRGGEMGKGTPRSIILTLKPRHLMTTSYGCSNTALSVIRSRHMTASKVPSC